MKKHNKYIAGLVVLSQTILMACTSESPFSTEGEGTLRMSVSVNSKLTRAEITEEETQKLLDNCIIYISDEVGLLHKWQGVSNMPEQLSLKYGNYTAEAWSGDSVSASFESKFYKGIEKFNLSADAPSKTIVLKCKLANVVGSVDTETINNDLMKNVVVTFANSRASLEYKEETLMEKGYFMMPDNETTLKYTVTGEGIDGKPFNKENVIENVQAGHEYRIKFIVDPSESTTGGVFFNIEIEEYEDEVDEEYMILGKPGFHWSTPSIEVGAQIVGIKGEFTPAMLKIAAHNDYSYVTLETSNMASYIGAEKYELVNINNSYDNYLTKLEEQGIKVQKCKEANDDGLWIWYITFSADLLNSLEVSDSEYKLTITATDGNGKSNSMDVRIANTEAAIQYDDPIIIDFETFNSDLTLTSANSVTIPVMIVDDKQKLLLQYKKETDSEWKSKDVLATRAGTKIVNITISGLEEGTTYEYRVVAGEETDGKYKFESETNKFTTEERFVIPNSSMEEWYMSGKSWVPMKDSSEVFWGTGNDGATTLGENYNITTQNQEFKNTGSSSACLKSQYVVMKLAAGNIFAGSFRGIEKVTHGIVDFGQKFNGSHPKSMKVFANYRPAIVPSKTAGDHLKSGDKDKGQIFIALSTSPVTVKTASQQYFNPKDDCIIGYGEVIWDNDFGSEGVLEEVTIPITYYDKAATTSPTYIIIVASASMYGDYFEGADGSKMYVDDFELIYE